MPLRRCGAMARPVCRDIGNIWLAVLVERCRHANDDRIDLVDPGEIRRRLKTICLDLIRNTLRRNMLNIAASLIQRVNFLRVHIESEDVNTASAQTEAREVIRHNPARRQQYLLMWARRLGRQKRAEGALLLRWYRELVDAY